MHVHGISLCYVGRRRGSEGSEGLSESCAAFIVQQTRGPLTMLKAMDEATSWGMHMGGTCL